MDINLACIAILDGEVRTREELAALAHAAGWQVQCFASAGEFLAGPRTFRPSCLILDVELPDMNGLELQARLLPRSELSLIFCTNKQDVSNSVRAMKAGAMEFLIKPICGEVMLNAIAHAIRQSEIILTEDQNLRILQDRYTQLSPREREVMALVAAGRLNKLIAAELDISEITVKAHRGRMIRKMKARSVPDLVKMSVLLGGADGQAGSERRQLPSAHHTRSWTHSYEAHRPRLGHAGV
jgi:FixJ family two-component response regulator